MPIINTNIAETINITENGQYDVAKYTTATVNVPSSPPVFNVGAQQFLGTVDANGVYQKPTTGETLDLTGVVKISGNMFARFAYSSITSVSAPDLVEVVNNNLANGLTGCSWLFTGSSLLTSVSFPVLKTVTGPSGLNAWFRGTGVTVVSFPELETCTSLSDLCMECNSLVSIDFPKLKQINNGVSNIAGYSRRGVTISFGSLDTFGNYTQLSYLFQNCNDCTVYFGAFKASTFTNASSLLLSYMCSGSYGTTVHFPVNLDPSNPDKTFDLSTVDGYPNFGGTNTTVLFDLPATE